MSSRSSKAKQCRKCKKTKLLREFHKEASNRDELSRWCKTCKREYNASRYQNRKKKTPYSVVKVKRCQKCNKVKSITEFHRSPNNVGGYFNYCVMCEAAYLSTWYKREEGRAKKYYKTHRKEFRVWSKAFRQTAKGKVCIARYNHKRRALLLSCKINDLESKQVRALLIAAKLCAICGKPFDKTNHGLKKSLDHITPLSRDGNNTASNIQIAHLSCNAKKHNQVGNKTEY